MRERYVNRRASILKEFDQFLAENFIKRSQIRNECCNNRTIPCISSTVDWSKTQVYFSPRSYESKPVKNEPARRSISWPNSASSLVQRTASPASADSKCSAESILCWVNAALAASEFLSAKAASKLACARNKKDQDALNTSIPTLGGDCDAIANRYIQTCMSSSFCCTMLSSVCVASLLLSATCEKCKEQLWHWNGSVECTDIIGLELDFGLSPILTLNSASASRNFRILGSTMLATSWYLHMAAAQLHNPATFPLACGEPALFMPLLAVICKSGFAEFMYLFGCFEIEIRRVEVGLKKLDSFIIDGVFCEI